MISPELLRRYGFFGILDDNQQKQVAMISGNQSYEVGEVVFGSDKTADGLYLLVAGSVDLKFVVQEEYPPGLNKEFLVGVINPGELFGISALIEPYIYSAAAVAAEPAQAIRIDALKLREMCDRDVELSCKLMGQVAKALMERLNFTRVQLAAARA